MMVGGASYEEQVTSGYVEGEDFDEDSSNSETNLLLKQSVSVLHHYNFYIQMAQLQALNEKHAMLEQKLQSLET